MKSLLHCLFVKCSSPYTYIHQIYSFVLDGWGGRTNVHIYVLTYVLYICKLSHVKLKKMQLNRISMFPAYSSCECVCVPYNRSLHIRIMPTASYAMLAGANDMLYSVCRMDR